MPGAIDTPTQQLRCHCGNVLARLVSGEVEIKFAAVNGRQVVIPVDTNHQSAGHFIRAQARNSQLSAMLSVKQRDASTNS